MTRRDHSPAVVLAAMTVFAALPLGCTQSSSLRMNATGGSNGPASGGSIAVGSDSGSYGAGGSQPIGSGGTSTSAGGAAGAKAGSGGLTSAGGSPSDGVPSGGTSGATGGVAGTTTPNTGGSPTTGGSTSKPDGSAGTTTTSTGGMAATGGAFRTGGSAGTTTTNTGGSAATGGATTKTGGASGTGGSTAIAGASGTGGAIGGTGGASGACLGCQPNESCWSDSSSSRCVESSVHLPTGLAIDATEVTRSQYAAWLATNPMATGQATVCAWNTSFTPDVTCMAKSSVCQGTACATHPQPCIDMCDAAAYCKAIGRGLCTDAGWTNACSSNGAYEAGYGTSLVFGTCNDYTAGTTTTVPVASETGCQAPASSGFAGVFDMIGNVGEWVDNCSPSDGATDTCKPRGLSFGTGAAAPTCSQSTYAKRSAVNDNVGFRCCTP